VNFTPRTHWIGLWVNARTGLDEDVENRKFLTQPVLELRPLGLLARSHSLYQLRYPGSPYVGFMDIPIYIYICERLCMYVCMYPYVCTYTRLFL
jgi:hypothetical protein